MGLPAGPGLRRTPGLCREELATLARISIDYYTRLERGKETHPSPSVVDSFAAALRLQEDEHEHLRSQGCSARRHPLSQGDSVSCFQPDGVGARLAGYTERRSSC